MLDYEEGVYYYYYYYSFYSSLMKGALLTHIKQFTDNGDGTYSVVFDNYLINEDIVSKDNSNIYNPKTFMERIHSSPQEYGKPAESVSLVIKKENQGVQEVYLFCVDGLKGFRESIAAVYPQAQIQRCIIHQIRSSTRYVSYKDIKTLMIDLKLVYKAVTEEEAFGQLMEFKDKWGRQYPSCVKSWEENWDILSTFYAYPPEVRKIIYTTNIIEGLNRQFRQLPRTNRRLPMMIL